MGMKDFNKAAADWDAKPRRVALAQGVTDAITREVTLSQGMEALEFGCGTGLVTLGLAPLLKSIVAVDSAPGMLTVLDGKLRDEGVENVSTLEVDPRATNLPEGPFDLIFSSMVLHHVEDPAGLVRELAARLAPGGYLALADLDAEDGSFHDEPGGVFHSGFGREEMAGMLRSAGVAEVNSVVAHTIEKQRGDETVLFPVLLTTGRKKGPA